MPKLVLDVSIYMQQTISADGIFRCIFFIAGEGLKLQKILLYKLFCIYGNLDPPQFYPVNQCNITVTKHVFSTRKENSASLHQKSAGLDLQFLFDCLLDLIHYVPVKNFSVMSGWLFLG